MTNLLIAETTKQIGLKYAIQEVARVSEFEVKQAIIKHAEKSFGWAFSLSDDNYLIDYTVEEYVDVDSLKLLLKKGDEGLIDILILCLTNKFKIADTEVRRSFWGNQLINKKVVNHDN